MPDRHPPLEPIAKSASTEEAAAVVAALEQFMRATAPPWSASTAQAHELDGWQQAAILEGVSRDPWADVPDPWINT